MNSVKLLSTVAAGVVICCATTPSLATTIKLSGNDIPIYQLSLGTPYDFGAVPVGETREAILLLDTSSFYGLAETDTWQQFADEGAISSTEVRLVSSLYLDPEIGAVSPPYAYELLQLNGTGTCPDLGRCWHVRVTSLASDIGNPTKAELNGVLVDVFNERVIFSDGSEINVGGDEHEYDFTAATYTPVSAAVSLPASTLLMSSALMFLVVVRFFSTRTC